MLKLSRKLFLPLWLLASLACSMTGTTPTAPPATPRPRPTREATALPTIEDPDPLPTFTPRVMPSATPTPFDPLPGTGEVTRQLLTYNDLMTSNANTVPVDESAFALPAEAAPPAFKFEGTLDPQGENSAQGFAVLRDDIGYAKDSRWQQLPPMSFKFVQSGSHLIPVDQALIYTGHAHWNYMVAPGRVWQEAGDAGMARASFPFALIERNQNCVHNGVMTFLFDAKTVSNVRYQITQETCLYFKFNMSGQLKATYTPSTIANAEALSAAHFTWLEHQLPTQPITALAETYPEVNLEALTEGFTPEHITTYGVYYNGVNYTGACLTRYGAYPYCAAMRLPSYSTAKSALAGVAYLRLAERYDPNLGELFIKDLLPQAARWVAVTLGDTLDMTTGHYERTAYMLDEYYSSSASQFILAEGQGDKLTYALQYSAVSAPGQQWVYHSTDTYLATQAMYAFLQKQTRQQTDLFDLLVADIFAPLHFSLGSQQSLRTNNRATGRAMGSHGMFFTQDDIAKLAAFLTVGQGAIDGVQLLNPDLLAATLQRDPTDRGVQTPNGEFWYNNSFWAKDYSEPCSYTVVFMSGYGGITVAMLPNHATYYIFSDNSEFTFDSAVAELQQLGETCP